MCVCVGGGGVSLCSGLNGGPRSKKLAMDQMDTRSGRTDRVV